MIDVVFCRSRRQRPREPTTSSEIRYSREPRPPPVPERRGRVPLDADGVGTYITPNVGPERRVYPYVNDPGTYLTPDVNGDYLMPNTHVQEINPYLSIISDRGSEARESTYIGDGYLQPMVDADRNTYLHPVTDNDLHDSAADSNRHTYLHPSEDQ